MELVLGGPAGCRMVDVSPVVSSDETALAARCNRQAIDVCGTDRRLFFASLKRIRSTFLGRGLTDKDVRGYFASWFGRSRMRECDQL